AKPSTAAGIPELQLVDVGEAFDRIGAMSGAGTANERVRLLHELLRRATSEEQDFLVRLLFGELRQGALEGVLVEAMARATGVSASALRRAVMIAGEMAPVARAILVDGEPGLSRFMLQIFQPVQPMLAQPATDVDEALGQFEEAALEWKIDGARIQVHKRGED